MATQTTIPATLRKPQLLRRLQRAAISSERARERERDASKRELKAKQGLLDAAVEARRSLEDELVKACEAFGED
jgi:hypothetical protein